MFNKFITASVIVISTMVTGIATAKAEPFVWGNTYTDYTYQKGFKGNPLEELKKHNATVGIEGGLTTDFIDAYGFTEYNASLDTQFSKASAHFNIYKGVSLYTQASDFTDGSDFNESHYVGGIGYTGLSGSGWAIKPFAALGYRASTFDTQKAPIVGWSGYMGLPDGMTAFSWHESEIKHGKMNHNGAIGFTQDITKRMYVGTTYRYFYNAAGVSGYGDALIARVGFHL